MMHETNTEVLCIFVSWEHDNKFRYLHIANEAHPQVTQNNCLVPLEHEKRTFDSYDCLVGE